jgi:hypothetical protein
MNSESVFVLIPQRALGQALGLSQKTVSNYMKKGMPNYSVAVAKEWIAARAPAAKRKPNRVPTVPKPR